MRRYPNLSGIICLIVISSISLPLLAMSAQGHNKDIGYILYGYSTWSDFEENATEDEKHSYYLVTDAAVFAIDEQGLGRNREKYNQLQKNIDLTGERVSLPHFSEFPSLGGGIHRAYNHQGFYYDYEDKIETVDGQSQNKFLERWKMGRDRILIPVTATAFKLEPNDPRAEALALIIYYSHIIGDLLEGSPDSMRQMKDVSTYYFMLQTFEYELGEILDQCGGRAWLNYRKLQAIGSFKRLRIQVNKQSHNKPLQYEMTKSFFREKIAPIVEMLLGYPTSQLKII